MNIIIIVLLQRNTLQYSSQFNNAMFLPRAVELLNIWQKRGKVNYIFIWSDLFNRVSSNQSQWSYHFGQSKKNTDNPRTNPNSKQTLCSWRKARENLCEWVTFGLGFTCDWTTKWHDSFKLIDWHSNAEPEKMQMTFDAQVKTALNEPYFRYNLNL